MRNESVCCKTKRKSPPKTFYLRPLRQMLGLVGMCFRSVLYSSNSEPLDEGMHVRANLTTGRHGERKEGVVSGERAPIYFFLPLDCVGEVFSYMACCILQIEAGARVDDGNVEWKRLIFVPRVIVEECHRFYCYVIRKWFNLPFCSLALSRKDRMSSTTNCTLLLRRDRASAWKSTRFWVGELHPVYVQDKAWRRVVCYRQPLP